MSIQCKRAASAASRMAVSAIALGMAAHAVAADATDWAATATRAIPLRSGLAAAPIDPAQPMHVVLGLAPRNKAALDALVTAVSSPDDPQFGRFITPDQFARDYAPGADRVNAVTSYLSSQGFSRIEVSDNHMAVSAYAPARSVQAAFNTRLMSFAADGRQIFANVAPAQVPSALGGVVSAVVGLQNIGTMALPMATPQNPLTTPPYSGPQYQVAYNAGKTSTGANTAIGIVTEGDISQVPKDLRAYEKKFNLPQVPYEIVPVGLQTTDTAGVGEWDLDSQSSSGIAQNLKKIIFYNAGSLADADLSLAFHKAVSENRVKAVNMSFGGCETIEFLTGAMLLDDIAFEQGAAQGMTFFASSGDGGASCQLLANAGEPVVLGAVEYPASSPYVVSVGGTSLLTNPGYSYNSEIAWISGGGGSSLWESSPVWTAGVVPPVNTTGGLRAVPDVAMVADPNIGGAAVVVNGADTGIGGTSLSSPLSVGVWARMQSGHGNCLGFAAPIFYKTFGQAFGTAAKAFHDVILGDNFLYPATPGWDYTTGLGTFDITAVNAGLPACPRR